MDDTIASRIEMVRAGFRFADGATETAYRDWYIDRALPFTRLGMVASLAGWLTTFAGAGFVDDWQPRLAPLVLGMMVPLLVGSFALTFMVRLRRLILPVTAIVNAIAGLAFVWGVGHVVVDSPISITMGASTVSLFALTIFRLHPAPASAAAMSYLVLAQILLVGRYNDHRLEGPDFVIMSTVLWSIFSVGFAANVAVERLTRRSFGAEKVVEEQNRTIAEERARSDALLENVLPREIANRLKTDPTAIADEFAEVTVLFADVVGFTPLAAAMDAPEIVRILNEVFTRFDELADRFGAEKIKTIGDAYMVVAGLPTPRPDHAEAAADLALAMRDAVAEHALDIRIGLATGPVVAGVIGRRKFAYDLWGDTVNTAARMESHGASNRIQVCEGVYRALHSSHEFKRRGLVDLKGKGPTPAYFLLGRQVASVRGRRRRPPATRRRNAGTTAARLSTK